MSIRCHAKVLRNPNSGSIIRVELLFFLCFDFSAVIESFSFWDFHLLVCDTRVSLVSYRGIFTQGTPIFVIVLDAIMSLILLELFVYKVILLHLLLIFRKKCCESKIMYIEK